MAREGALPAARAVAILLDVCSALEAAHGAGIIHRDLKPGNIMVEAREGLPQVARVLDFGMAKMFQPDGANHTALTEPNMIFGTPEYMAPEQARGDELDETCDIYAAGTILYELLVGSVPFTRTTPIATMTAQLIEPIVAPSPEGPGARDLAGARSGHTMCAREGSTSSVCVGARPTRGSDQGARRAGRLGLGAPLARRPFPRVAGRAQRGAATVGHGVTARRAVGFLRTTCDAPARGATCAYERVPRRQSQHGASSRRG